MTGILDKRVCSNCAGVSLGRYIKLHGENDICDYCGKNKNPVISIDELLPRMYESWGVYYSNYDDSFFSDNFRTPYYVSDIINDDLVELTDANDFFLNDLCELPEDRRWQKDSEYWTSFQEALKSSWERFCIIVKKQWLYTYFLCEKDELAPATYSPIDTMKIICELIVKSKESLIKELQANTSIFRTRKDNKNFYINAKEMGTAPEKYTKANRFSPKGIPMFYGSLDEKTCIKEASGKGTHITTYEFRNSRPIKLLDLTNLPSIPKLYDDDFYFIPALEFLHNFSQNITKEAKDDEVKYIPTQVFTEYIRLQGLQKLNIKGIQYKSSKNIGGKNVVLFYTNEECKDKDDGSDCLVLNKIF